MSNVVFPSFTGLAFPVEKTPNWSTKVQTHASGKETRLSMWSYPRWDWSLSYDVLRSNNAYAELQQLVGFFNSRQGAFDSWLFNDPDDNTAVAQTFGTGNGSTTAFQLARSYGGYSEPVKAVNTITSVTLNGTPTGSYSLNYNTGVVTFGSPPGAGVTLAWSGTFYWRVRFSDDYTTVEKFMKDFWESRSIKFQSIK